MTLQLSVITNAETWDNALARLPNAHALQSWAWGKFKSGWGWQPTRMLWHKANGQPAAAAQILRRPLLKTPWSMLYVSKGPAWDYTDLSLVEQVIASLENYAKQNKALFIKLDPDVTLAFEPTAPQPYLPGVAVQELLKNRTWQYSSQQIQFKNTVVIDLEQPEEELLAMMKSKWRYNIRLAKRKGVTVAPGGVDDLETFYQLYQITSQRNNFLIRPKAYYLDLWRQYLQLPQNRATLLLAKVNNIVVAGILLFYFESTAWYMYGASDNQYRNLMPNHLLQWEAIKQAKARECSIYDLWGAPNTLNETDSMWGVYKFKLGLGGTTRQGLGAYDFPVHSRMYQFYIHSLPKALSTLRKLR